MKPILNGIERLIFASRWVQLPMYVGLIIGLALYVLKFFSVLWHLCLTFPQLSNNEVMLQVLELIDITMIANLLIMVILGGYANFVSKLDIKDEDRPDWLDKVDAGTLKIKLSVSLVSISGIHLLSTFVKLAEVSFQVVMWQVIIHLVFLISVLLLTWSDKLAHKKYIQRKISTDS